MTPTTAPLTNATSPTSQAPTPHPTLPVRKIKHLFDAIPRNWQSGSVLASAISDGVNLLFPVGERFFIRSVRRFESKIQNPELLSQLRGFYGQEGNHTREHERYFEILRERGHDLDGFLHWLAKSMQALEDSTPATWSLAATAAAEHFTAIMADQALTDNVFENAHPVMRDLLSWHAAEEIEHKAVAFDVLQAVDPRYRTRVIGLIVATAFLGTWWSLGTLLLIAQSGLSPKELRADFEELQKFQATTQHTLLGDVFGQGIRTYLKRDFHPWQEQNMHLAEAYLKQRPDIAAA